MKHDAIIAEVRNVRVELDREHPTGAAFYRYLKQRERELGTRLVRRQPVKQPPLRKTA